MRYEMLRAFVKELSTEKRIRANGIAGMWAAGASVPVDYFDVFNSEETELVKEYAGLVREKFHTFSPEQQALINDVIKTESEL